jgi:hypothetical protein
MMRAYRFERKRAFTYGKMEGGTMSDNRITLRKYLALRNLNPGCRYDLEEYLPDTTFLAEKASCDNDSSFLLFRFQTSKGQSVFLVDRGTECRLIAEKDWDFELANSRDLMAFTPAGRPVDITGKKG